MVKKSFQRAKGDLGNSPFILYKKVLTKYQGKFLSYLESTRIYQISVKNEDLTPPLLFTESLMAEGKSGSL